MAHQPESVVENPFEVPDGIQVTVRGRLRADNRSDYPRRGPKHPRHYEDDFLIGTCDCADAPNGKFDIKGYMAQAGFGETYELTGEWETHDRYGRQLKITSARLVLPDTEAGIRRYLSKTKSHVGEPIARAIVNKFGKDSLDVLREHPERVAEAVPGITVERARVIAEELIQDGEMAEARVNLEQLLAGYKLSDRVVTAVLAYYGTNAALVVRDNPYSLTMFHGVGFRTADTIALNRVEYPEDGIERRKAAVMHAMRENLSRNGHTVMDREWMEREVIKLIRMAPGDDAVSQLIEDGYLANTSIGDPGLQLTDDRLAEESIAERLRKLSERPPRGVGEIDTDGLTDGQAAFCEGMARHNVIILTGGPGTGKTFTADRVVRARREAVIVAVGDSDEPPSPSVMADIRTTDACAPTGKAAKRVAESTGLPARTIHSLLRLIPNDDGDFTASDDPVVIDPGLLIIDETSMVDTALFAALLDRVADTTQVLIIGDTEQLQSVGRGAVLRDMRDAGIPTYNLTEIMRNAGPLLEGVHAVGRGECPVFCDRLDPDNGLNIRFLEVDGERVATGILRTLDRIAELGHDPAWDCQVVSPVNRTQPVGVDPLNEMLAPYLLKADVRDDTPFRTGEKVIQTKNGMAATAHPGARGRYTIDHQNEVRVVNGDLGRVLGFGTENVNGKDRHFLAVRHWYPDRTVAYPVRKNTLKMAWAMTVHKMQGSSAPFIIIPVHRSFAGGPIWTREWLYTGISRAETACILVGEMGLFRRGIAKATSSARDTRLRHLIEEAML